MTESYISPGFVTTTTKLLDSRLAESEGLPHISNNECVSLTRFNFGGEEAGISSTTACVQDKGPPKKNLEVEETYVLEMDLSTGHWV